MRQRGEGVEHSAIGDPAAGDDGAPDDYQYDDGSNSDSGKTTVAEPPAEKGGPVSLISNNIAWVGGGAVFLLVILIAAAFMRNRPRNYGR